MPFLRARGRWLAPAATLALGVVAMVVGRSRPNPADAPPAVFLGVVAAGVLALLTLAAPPPAARRLAALSLLFVPLLAWPLDDPTAWAIAFALLAAAALGAALAASAAGTEPRPLRWIAWTTATQWILHADRIWQGPRDAAALVELVGAPAAAGLLVARLSRHDPRLGLVAALLALIAGPGWTPAALAALAAATIAVAALSRTGRRGFEPFAGALATLHGLVAEPWLAVALAGLGIGALSPAAAAARPAPRRLLDTLSRGAFAAITVGALLALGAGALPWSLDRPLVRLLDGVERNATSVPQVLHEGRSLRLGNEPLRFDSPAGSKVRTLALDSFLLDGAALECGRPVAELALVDGERTVWTAPVLAGRATGDWAAERPDVAARAACDGPRAFLRWPAPGGRFLTRRYRAVWRVEGPLAASRLELRPVRPDPGARLVVTRLAIGS